MKTLSYNSSADICPKLYSVSLERSRRVIKPSYVTSAFISASLQSRGYDDLLSRYMESLITSAKSTIPLTSTSPLISFMGSSCTGSVVVVVAVVVDDAPVERVHVIEVMPQEGRCGECGAALLREVVSRGVGINGWRVLRGR